MIEGVIRRLTDSSVIARDHLQGFDSAYQNDILKKIPAGTTVYSEYIFSDDVKAQYSNLYLKFDADLMIQGNCLDQLTEISKNYNVPDRLFLIDNGDFRITHFLCCFNRSAHPSREWAISWLHQLNWFNSDFCSKHFPIQHHFCHTHPELRKQYREKSFDQAFMNSIISLDYIGLPTNHKSHLSVLGPKIQKSFVQLVTETVAESYYPFPTEKMLYPILNKTLWVAYAQPYYYQFIETHMGVKKYKTFDYTFDSILDPLDRLKAITDMLAPFSSMSVYDWHDIYLTEKDTIDYNLDLIKSGKLLKTLRSFDERLEK